VEGHSSHDESNGTGEQLKHFAVQQRMKIGGTLFPHKSIHKGTWRSPDGRTVNQIDHVLTDERHRANLLEVRSFRGANPDTDHHLSIAGLRGRTAKMTDKWAIKMISKYVYDTHRLKTPEVKQEYVNKFVTHVEESDNSNINWQTLQQIITETADEVIGKIERVERKELYYDDECKKSIKSKNAYYRMIQKYYTKGDEE
jgi:hypothetical protein